MKSRILASLLCATALGACQGNNLESTLTTSAEGFSSLLPFSGYAYQKLDKPLIQTAAVEKIKATPPQPRDLAAGEEIFSLGLTSLAVNTTDQDLQIEAADEFLQGVLERLEAGWGHPFPEVDIVLVSSPYYDAKAFDQHYIKVNIGVLALAKTEDEVAAVLAHEMAHILLDHFAAEQKIRERQELLEFASSTSMVALDFASTFDNTEIGKVAKDIKKYASLVDVVSAGVLDPGWKRSQEDEADLLAVDLLMAAKYQPSKMVDMLDRINAMENQQKSVVDYYSEGYKQYINAQMKAGNFSEGLNKTFEMLPGVALAVVAEKANDIASGHASAESRNENTSGYMDKFYQARHALALTTTALETLQADEEFSSINEAVTKAYTAKALAENGNDPIKAITLAREALTGALGSSPVASYALYVAEKDRGNDTAALYHLENAVQTKLPSVPITRALMKEYGNRKTPQKGLALLDKIQGRYGQSDLFMANKIALLQQSGKSSEALSLLDQCKGQSSARIKDQCTMVWQQLTASNPSLKGLAQPNNTPAPQNKSEAQQEPLKAIGGFLKMLNQPR